MHHTSVLKHEAIELLAISPGDTVIDATVGAGGYTRELIQRVGRKGVVLGIDCDSEALERVQKEFINSADVTATVHLVHSQFSRIISVCRELRIHAVDAIVADLGISSMQLDRSERGLSFRQDGPLDMRLNKLENSRTASDIIAEYTQEKLARIFHEYADELYAKAIAAAIVKARQEREITTTGMLHDIVMGAIPVAKRFGKRDGATRVFQALRMEVNNEISELHALLSSSLEILRIGGRMSVVSFHSGEDVIVKRFIRDNSNDCTCPPEFPVCRCQTMARVKSLTKKPIIPTEAEISANPRSRSAKLRGFEKIA